MARAQKTTSVEEIRSAPIVETVLGLRDELVAIAAAALVTGDHAAHALADSLLQDVVTMRGKLVMAPELDGEIAAIIAKLKAIL